MVEWETDRHHLIFVIVEINISMWVLIILFSCKIFKIVTMFSFSLLNVLCNGRKVYCAVNLDVENVNEFLYCKHECRWKYLKWLNRLLYNKLDADKSELTFVAVTNNEI